MKKPQKPNPQRATTAAVKKSTSSEGNTFMKVAANIGGALLAGIFLMTLFSHHEPDPQNPTEKHLNAGYDWLLNSMLKSNLETISQHPELTTQQRYEAKWGGEIAYINQVKNQTTESAVILFPTKAMMKESGFKSVGDIAWLEYFLYPRKLVYEDDKAKSPLYAQVTHVVSMNGWGLDKLKYTVEKPEGFMILPINK
jgi:hypothetical protein